MEPLVAVTRNNYIESVHYGYICITNSHGEIIYSSGDINTSIFFRSSAKPLQIIPLIDSGAAKAFGFTMGDIALACSSHSGDWVHQERVSQILDRLNLTDKNLLCGIMEPYDGHERLRLASAGISPTVFHCSCSGKHTAILALAKFKGYSIQNYREISHPIQKDLQETVAYFADIDSKIIRTGIDGCGIPIYLLPIKNIALSYSKLIMETLDPHGKYHQACRLVFDSMTSYPEMVAGEREFCTDLMRVAGDRLIGKVGSEGVYCVGVKEGHLGICIKIADGNERALFPLVLQTLMDLDILKSKDIEMLKDWYRPKVKNNLQEVVGEIVPIPLKSPSSKRNRYIIGKEISLS